MSWRDLDEDDIRVRPQRKGRGPAPRNGRPTPTPSSAGSSQSIAAATPAGPDRAGGARPRRVTQHGADRAGAAGHRHEGSRPRPYPRVVVGDEVGLVGNTSGGPDALARIVRIEERRSVLRRTADDTDPVERVIVANADQLAIVTALKPGAPTPHG